MKYWLIKSEPATFAIDDLAAAPRRRTGWDGVRNYQARNMLRDEMRRGDLAFFYHSSCEVPGVYGIVKVVKGGYPDPTAFERGHDHYDPGSDPAVPRWFSVDVALVRRFARPITLAALKGNARAIGDLVLLRKGVRLSIMPVTADEWRGVLALE